MVLFVTLALGTLVSEDLTCITAGLLVQRGEIGAASAVLACGLGIFAGDFALWAAGRAFGGAALAWPRVAKSLRGPRSRQIRRWLDRHAAGAIVASRFVPGTRLPLYVTAGVVRFSGVAFAVWSLVGVILWTPTIVLLTASLGDAFVTRVAPVVGLGWPARAGAAAAILCAIRVTGVAATRTGRVRIAARAARWARWEFWPMWLFYAPVALWVALLALRHRGLTTVTAANPGMPDGGTVGESKFDILRNLPPEWTVPSIRIAAGTTDDRLSHAERLIEEHGWTFPLIVKPDVGERGTGVKLARDPAALANYLTAVHGDVLIQPYHPGPFEAGVFYYRFPAWTRGRILSITDKHFPFVVGDGVSTLEALIWAHPRCRLQADTFLARHRDVLDDVPDTGERVRLAIAGNHAQGTLFRDGAHLITPALERRIDEVARAYPGFFVGRFDIRYQDVEAFKAGRDLAIIELNGATAESTNIYDPSGSLWNAYRLLFRQWAIVFAIGAANRAEGVPVTSMRRLVALVRIHATRAVAYEISD